MRVFPLGFGVLCEKGSGISRVWLWLSGLSKMRGGGRFSLTPQVSSPEGWHCKGGEQTFGDRACRAQLWEHQHSLGSSALLRRRREDAANHKVV